MKIIISDDAEEFFNHQMKAILRSIFYMPGVIIHELAHHLFCIIFKTKVIDVCYYNFKDSSGYVLHHRPKHLYQEILISTAPFFINSFIGGLVAYPTVTNKLSTTGLLSINWQDFLRIIISISIGMNAIPSNRDGLNVWNSVGNSDMNFFLKILSQLIIAPLFFVIYLLNYGSSYLRIDLLYGFLVCFIGPKFINFKYLEVIKEFINGFQNFQFLK